MIENNKELSKLNNETTSFVAKLAKFLGEPKLFRSYYCYSQEKVMR